MFISWHYSPLSTHNSRFAAWRYAAHHNSQARNRKQTLLTWWWSMARNYRIAMNQIKLRHSTLRLFKCVWCPQVCHCRLARPRDLPFLQRYSYSYCWLKTYSRIKKCHNPEKCSAVSDITVVPGQFSNCIFWLSNCNCWCVKMRIADVNILILSRSWVHLNFFPPYHVIQFHGRHSISYVEASYDYLAAVISETS